jgi:diguanylate cyclase (GGDEF)-like protein
MKATPHKSLLWRWAEMGVDPTDSGDLRLKKAVMTIVSSSIALLAIFWGGLYLYSGYPLSAAVPLGYAIISFSSTLHFFKTKRFAFFCFSQQLFILLLPFLLMWSLGGFANGSVVMIWAFFAPLAALFFIDLKAAARWMLAFLVLLIVSALFDQALATHVRPMPGPLNTLYFLMNTGCGFTLMGLILYYFVKDRESAYEKLRQRELDIRELMLTDPLTGVANRRHLDEQLALELARRERYQQPLSVIMTDIDWFKRVNDTYGHAVGDTVLTAFATELSKNIRASDFLARYGGEEFIVLLPNTASEEAVSFAERLREAIKHLCFKGLELNLTASFGVILVKPNESMAQVVARADKAMYQSKSHGKDRVTLFTD